MIRPGASPLAQARIQPLRAEKQPPCCAGCASGADVRGWIATIAQRRKLGLSDAQAFALAWRMVTAVNPLPAVMGRICPHPCQDNCSRGEKDGVVAINALERFLGDWGLAHGLELPRLEQPAAQPESIGVIGAGPAGLSFAYQMARRGYRVTVYEKESKPGGMLYYGIPQYRLPEAVIEAEVRRIFDLGIDFRPRLALGRDMELAGLQDRHEILFIAIGAGRGLRLEIPGEDGPGVWTGTEYLARLNRGEPVALGRQVVVVGGGNTAVDAARAARRDGAEVVLVYRRTRAEMPAIQEEVDDAIAEGVRIEFLAAPVRIVRDAGRVLAVVIQRMELGETDQSGRRRPVPVRGSESQLAATSVLSAVSQQPDWQGVRGPDPGTIWAAGPELGDSGGRLWTGGDTRGPGIAGQAISQGRRVAELVHARLRRIPASDDASLPPLPRQSIKPDFYVPMHPVVVPRKPASAWVDDPDAEMRGTITEEEFLQEIARCFSCGLCYGCEQCFMYCSAGGFILRERVAPGAYFALDLERCQACGKCIDLCPCGFLEPI